MWLLLLFFAAENILVVAFPHPWFNLYLYRGLPVVFGLALVFFGRAQFRTSFGGNGSLNAGPLRAHLVVAALLVGVEVLLSAMVQRQPQPLALRPLVWFWLGLFPALLASLLLIFLPFRKLLLLGRSLGSVWFYASVASALVVVLRERFREAWGTSSSWLGSAAQTAAFNEAQWCLRRFYPVVVQDPATHLLGTSQFRVIVGGTCSGLEGLALVSAFSVVWLVYARRELRLERALLLIPIALGLMWCLNVVRLVGLIAIGDAGYPEIATQGFHSEAGWIAFNVVSLAFLLTAQRIAFFRRAGVPVGDVAWSAEHKPGVRSINIPAVYLGPFLAITAVGVISQASSAGFEPLYPLRFVIVLGVFWMYRREYLKMDWQFGLLSLGTGLAVALMWLAFRALRTPVPVAALPVDATAAALAAMSPARRWLWVLLRVLAAVSTVPIAEELAFRGYLARRLMDRRPELVSYSRLSAWAIAGSSVVFGMVHGQMWLPGILAGVAFALLARWKGRLGDAVAAHATANLGIAVVALLRHDYSLW